MALPLVLLASGCAIASRSDKFGADVEFALGGVLSYIVDVRFKGSIGFSKTCLEEGNHAALHYGGPGEPPHL